jgi:cytochrome oxidase Cu insertion factor (SCO1/SenC/PrrC family)
MSGRAFALVIILMAVATGVIAVVANHVIINAAQRAAEASKVSSGFIGEFELVDQDGRTVRAEDLRGKYQLVFFGCLTGGRPRSVPLRMTMTSCRRT